MKGDIFKEEWFRFYDTPPNWDACDYRVGCDPAATGRKTTSDFWTTLVGARLRQPEGGYTRDIYLKEVWRSRCTKQEYLDHLRRLNEVYQPQAVLLENVAAQEYLAQDAEASMPVRRVERTKDKVSRAYWLQPSFDLPPRIVPLLEFHPASGLRPETWSTRTCITELHFGPRPQEGPCLGSGSRKSRLRGPPFERRCLHDVSSRWLGKSRLEDQKGHSRGGGRLVSCHQRRAPGSHWLPGA